jgi:hypothetical protein
MEAQVEKQVVRGAWKAVQVRQPAAQEVRVEKQVEKQVEAAAREVWGEWAARVGQPLRPRWVQVVKMLTTTSQ